MSIASRAAGRPWADQGAACSISTSAIRSEGLGLYAIRFFAALDSGARLEARGLLTVVAGEERREQG
jgi:hypothetical protein